MMPALIFLFLPQLLKLADQPFQEVGEGAANWLAGAAAERNRAAGGQGLAVQDKIELIRP